MFKAKDFEFELGKKTYIMGILNVNPDSFSDNKKGVKNYYFRAVAAVVMIFIIPLLFDYSFEIQSNLLKNNYLTTRVLGYEVKEVTPVDMFPRTSHVETVVLLSRKDIHERIKFDVNVEKLERLNKPE